MNRKKLLLGAGFVGAFLLGCLFGGAVVFIRTVPPMAEMLALATLSEAGTEAHVKYRYGTYPVAKTALLQYVDQVKGLYDARRMLGPKSAAFDVGLAYGRLAIVAERAGEREEAAHYMKLARQALSEQGQPAEETQVRGTIERLDRAWDQRLSAGTK